MRVFFPLVALLAGAQALSSSPPQKRAGLDVCAYLDTSCAFPNPLTGKPIDFGNIGENFLMDPPFDQSAEPGCLVYW